MILAPGERRGKGWEGKGLEVPPRGSSFNLEQGCVVGSGLCRGAGAGQPGAGGRPCSRLSVLSLCVCVCVRLSLSSL